VTPCRNLSAFARKAALLTSERLDLCHDLRAAVNDVPTEFRTENQD